MTVFSASPVWPVTATVKGAVTSDTFLFSEGLHPLKRPLISVLPLGGDIEGRPFESLV